MLYSFRYPPEAEKRIRDECKNTGEELPKEIADKPRLWFGLALYLNAWHELDGERDRNELERIRRSAVLDYALYYDFDGRQAEELWYYVRRMDKAFLDWYKSKMPKR